MEKSSSSQEQIHHGLKSIDEKQKEEEMHEAMKKDGSLTSPPTSPKAINKRMTKSKSGKMSCLCSPTTHPGSFRCRLHRSGMQTGLSRGSSVGANLYALGS
ncbi:hypothetical protein Tsubulata_023753 [Turnera subulata]|uniref:Uncharacterized protein n=1 Tax=Turnera subulata TaxID=218843 RepID=A0A9Q0FCF5_9ROSI|nr:hypothetical protein Tsubulata_023753 [Turnera subulata]